MNDQFDCVIVGGGAAGLWAAGTAADRGRKTLVLEKNVKLGVKILMSGGTRCNVTHDCGSAQIAAEFGPEGRALLSPLSRLSPQQVVEIFDQLGVPTKSEPGGKIFPVSDSAVDVRDAVVKRASDSGATLRSGVSVKDISVDFALDEKQFIIATDNETYQASSVLICTGGLSYSPCGTTGDGYAWLEKLGHRLATRRPALAPILTTSERIKSLQGLTIADAVVRAKPANAYSKKLAKHRHEYRGGLLWTHFGCSGPTAMNVSRWISDLDSYQTACLDVDLLPSDSSDDLSRWLAAGKVEHGAKQVKNFLQTKFPQRLVEVILQECRLINPRTMAELSKQAIEQIVTQIKGLRVPVCGTRGYPKAEVTAGGVELHEVNFQTMESKIVPGLFLAGEILNLDGPIGGYNFQAAWSTGHTAGLFM